MAVRTNTGADDAALAGASGVAPRSAGTGGRLPAWLPAVALSSALTAILLIWDPQVRDLAAQAFRTELFQREGFAIWNGAWYEGHYTLTYSVLFPPLAAVVGPQLVGGLSAIASAYLFDRLVRDHWGERARWATLWFGAGAVTMLATGRVTFSLGVACGLAALRALQTRRTPAAIAAAAACALSSPVAGVFLAGVTATGAVVRTGPVNRAALVVAAVAALPIAALNLVFPDESVQPFSFAAFFPVLLYAAVTVYLTRGKPEERRFRFVVLCYLAATTLVWLIPNPLGNNAIRLPALFGGPLLLAIILARRPRVPIALSVTILVTAAFWQFLAPARDLAQSAGDASTSARFYHGLEDWLRAHGGKRARVEVPTTLNTWEAAYLAPEFQLARGWLGQLDRARNGVFYNGRLTHERYRRWLRHNGVRYVALPDAPLQQSARPERRLILDGRSYLAPRWTSAHWRVYEVVDPLPLVRSQHGRARLKHLQPESFTLRVTKPGTFTVLARSSPYWEIARGKGCISERNGWTTITTAKRGVVRADVGFSVGGALRSASRTEPTCAPAAATWGSGRWLRGL